MITKTIHHNGAVLTVRRSTIRDRIRAQMILNKLGINADDIEDFLLKRLFARVLIQVSVEGEPGFPFPGPADSADELLAAMERFLDEPATLYDDLEEALFAVDQPVNEPDLLPDAKVPEKKD